MKLILALVLGLAGIAAGGAAGLWLRGDPETPTTVARGDAAVDNGDEASGEEPPSYVTVGRQLIVPVVNGGETRALMLFEIALEVPEPIRDLVLAREPRLRDAFLRELFGLAQSGVFLGSYTSERTMADLREKLLAAARLHLGPDVQDVLILDALRQEL